MKKRDILLAGGIVLVALVMLLVMHVTGETKGDQVQITRERRNLWNLSAGERSDDRSY